jgi:hypothetical protein
MKSEWLKKIETLVIVFQGKNHSPALSRKRTAKNDILKTLYTA